MASLPCSAMDGSFWPTQFTLTRSWAARTAELIFSTSRSRSLSACRSCCSCSSFSSRLRSFSSTADCRRAIKRENDTPLLQTNNITSTKVGNCDQRVANVAADSYLATKRYFTIRLCSSPPADCRWDKKRKDNSPRLQYKKEKFPDSLCEQSTRTGRNYKYQVSMKPVEES